MNAQPNMVWREIWARYLEFQPITYQETPSPLKEQQDPMMLILTRLELKALVFVKELLSKRRSKNAYSHF